MKKLNKTEFMSLTINYLYEKKRLEREKEIAAEIHSINNHYKIQKSISRRKRV